MIEICCATLDEYINIYIMKESKWLLWFILSTIWLLSMFMITMIATPSDIKELGKNWLFVFGYITCLLNMLSCVYVGSLPSDE